MRPSLLLAAFLGIASARVLDYRPDYEKLSARQESLAYKGYMFAYFTGNDINGEKIYFAASKGNNALDWTELNGGQPVLTSTYGTKGLRDPFIIRSKEGDRFFLIATDLSIGSGTSWGESVRTGSRYLEVWESEDLITWSEQRHVLVSPPTAGNTWAPEAYYDDSIGAYAVFWASSLYEESDSNRTGNTYHRMLYATTQDFVTFSEPRIWQDAGTSRIDSTVLKAGDQYYRFTKDEGAVSGCTDIIQESSPVLLDQLAAWKAIATCIGRDAGTQAIEGPTAFKSNPGDVNGDDKFYLFVDEYGGRGYIPLETADIALVTGPFSPSPQRSSQPSLPASQGGGRVLSFQAYFSGQNPTYDRKTIGVAVASSPEGPFTAETTALILNNEAVKSGQAIDPAAFFDPQTGKSYLYWGNGNPVMAELADDVVSLVPDTIHAVEGLTDFREGTFVNYRAPFYHLTYSIDDTGSPDYRVGYATGPRATGPWTYHGILLSKDVEKGLLGTAHNAIINVPGTDHWYIAYHRFAIPGGNGTNRETTIDRLYFSEETGLMETVVPTVNGVSRAEDCAGL